MHQQRNIRGSRPRRTPAGKAVGCGCFGLLALAFLGGIGAIFGDDDSTAPTSAAPECPAVEVTGLPTEQRDVTVTTGKAKCDAMGATNIPVTVTNGGDEELVVSLTLRVEGADGSSELETILVAEPMVGGAEMGDTAEVRARGDLASSEGGVMEVDEFTVTTPEPEPTETQPEPTETADVDLPDGDVDRPNKCKGKWYC